MLKSFLFSLGTLLVTGGTFSAELWRTGYMPGWEQSAMPASSIDYSTLTHVIHFSVVPNSDGSLDFTANSLTSANSSDLVLHAHAAGRKALICVGGANSQSGFQSATSSAHLATFIKNLTDFMSQRGYDGIDIDWEPLDASDASQVTNLVNGLRNALDAMTPRPLLTAAIAAPPTPPSLIAAVHPSFDQINLMTYDLSGAYPGWVTWFNSPLFNGGYRFASTGGLVPSVDGMVSAVIAAGVPASKLGIGIAFYGWVWSGGAGTSTGGAALPRQSWTTPPATSQISYNTILSTYLQPDNYRWDANAQAAYLTIDNAGAGGDKFISFEDPRACQSKVSYARNRGLGGVMIWELAQDHRSGQSDPLLQSIKQALATPGNIAIQLTSGTIDLSFQTIPLGSYRIQWTDTLTIPFWNTLSTTNISGPGGVIHILDPETQQPTRIYRIQTPP